MLQHTIVNIHQTNQLKQEAIKAEDNCISLYFHVYFTGKVYIHWFIHGIKTYYARQKTNIQVSLLTNWLKQILRWLI